tara:strand:+ start:2596 stop:3165 length:570 start_codon:yes stop_codon:yes gene_type:complete
VIKIFKTAFVAFGGNINSSHGEPRATISAALKMLESTSLTVLKTSGFYSTPAVPEGSGPSFINVVAKISTNFNAYELLNKFHMIENEFDRRRIKRWSPRSIDIDLLTLENQVLPSTVEFLRWATLNIDRQLLETPKSLVLPHPRLHHRAFVLLPLNEIDKTWVHPVFKKSVNQMFEELEPDAYKNIKLL